MTILEGLSRIVGIPADKIRAMLVAGKTAVPDLADTIDAKLALLDSAVSAAALSVLADIIRTEIPKIAQGQFEGKPRPSDLV